MTVTFSSISSYSNKKNATVHLVGRNEETLYLMTTKLRTIIKSQSWYCIVIQLKQQYANIENNLSGICNVHSVFGSHSLTLFGTLDKHC